ncbi:MAG: hypothetical protein LBD22_01615 [Spirochaetaceae bacterium]|jgi:hypothetical protein|nr:hypothetical protein [Spirochaetaceae bacterium]
MIRFIRAQCTALFIIVSPALFAGEGLFQYAPPFQVVSVRESGYGGPHAAFANGLFSLFSNVAALSSVQESTVFGVGVDLAPLELSHLINVLTGSDLDAGKLAEYTAANLSRAPPPFSFQGPLFWGYTGKSIGIGAFNRSHIGSTIEYDDSNGTAVYRARLYNDIVAGGGLAANAVDTALHKLDFGIGAYFFFRNAATMLKQTQSVTVKTARNVLDAGYTFGYNSLGMGLSCGMLYRYSERFALGISANNVPAASVFITADEDDKPAGFLFVPEVNAGMAFRIIYTNFLVWSVMLDLRDMLAQTALFTGHKVDALLSLTLGMEFVFRNTVALRLGFADMLPSFGLGFDAGGLKFNGAFYGAEYGAVGGVYSTWNIALGVQLTRN